jgi:4-hydroxy-tetrahydrodipicolinate synthase
MEKCQPIGVFTSLVTPMNYDGDIDWAGYKDTLDFQYRNSVAVQRFNSDSGHVFVGTGDCDINNIHERAINAKKLGADALLVNTPGPSKLDTTRVREYYHRIADIMPVIVDNLGDRISLNDIGKISEHPNIMGVRCGYSLKKASDLSNIVAFNVHQTRPFYVWAGDDLATVSFTRAGANGVFSIASNLSPSLVQSLLEPMHTNITKYARNLEYKVADLLQAIEIESNPAPIKYMMFKMGLIKSPAMKPPMGPLEEKSAIILRRVLKKHMERVYEI